MIWPIVGVFLGTALPLHRIVNKIPLTEKNKYVIYKILPNVCTMFLIFIWN